MTKKQPPKLPTIFIPDHLPEINNAVFEEQMRICSQITQKQMASVMSYCLKNHQCIHERALVLGLISGLITVFQSILEPTDDEAVKVMRLASFKKIECSVLNDIPLVTENMAKFYAQIIDITLKDKGPEDGPTGQVPEPDTSHLPATPAASVVLPSSAPKPAPKWLN